MKWARFKPDGTVELIVSNPFAGAIAVDDDANPVDLFCDPDTGAIGRRQVIELQCPRTIFCCDGEDAAPLPPVPEGASVIVNGQVASAPITQTAPAVMMVEVGGNARAARRINWQFKTRGQIQEELRGERSARLTATDWTTLPDAVLTEAQRLAFQTYRTLLRDLPAAQPNATIETVIWPEEP